MGKENFEEKITLMKELIQKMETGELDIEESVETYAKTMETAKEAGEILEKAENTIKDIINKQKDE